MKAMRYLPKPHCVKCRKNAIVHRINPSGANRPRLLVRCHGETQEIDFPREQNQTVEVFASEQK